MPGSVTTFRVHDDLLAAVRAYVLDCLNRATPPRASELAQRLGLSRTRLNRRLRAEHGTTATDALQNEQLDVAKRLLRETALSVTEIAKKVAFGRASVSSAHSFARPV